MRLVFTMFFLSFLFISCSSAQEVKKEQSKQDTLKLLKKPEKLNFRINDFYGLELSTIYTVEMANDAVQTSGQIKIAAYDSVSLNLNGPMGIALGKLFASPQKFVYFNIFEKIAFEGSPNSRNLQAAARINLDYNDLISILRNETPNKKDELKEYSSDKDKEIYINKRNNYVEFIVFNKAKDRILQYQRKDLDNKLIFRAEFLEFEKISNSFLPKKINVEFPEIKTKLKLEINEYKIFDKFEKPFSFQLPKSVRIINLDEIEE